MKKTPTRRKQSGEEFGANPDDIARLEAFAGLHELKALESSMERRSVRLESTPQHVRVPKAPSRSTRHTQGASHVQRRFVDRGKTQD